MCRRSGTTGRTESGGPLHLINVTVNQTVDFTSQRGNRDRKGENVAVSTLGMTVGQKWHGAWSRLPEDRARQRAGEGADVGDAARTHSRVGSPAGRPDRRADQERRDAVAPPVDGDLGRRTRSRTRPDDAARDVAAVRTRQPADRLLVEQRHHRGGARRLPGADVLLARLVYVLESLFATQTLLLFEWVARYPGPWEQLLVPVGRRLLRDDSAPTS